MKKLMGILLGLSLVIGTSTFAFSQEKKEEAKKETKKKGKRTGAKKADADKK